MSCFIPYLSVHDQRYSMCQTSYLTFQSLSKDTPCVKLHTLPFSPCPKILHVSNFIPYLSVHVQRYYIILTFQSISKDTTCVKLHTLPFSSCPKILHNTYLSVHDQRYYMCQTSHLTFQSISSFPWDWPHCNTVVGTARSRQSPPCMCPRKT